MFPLFRLIRGILNVDGEAVAGDVAEDLEWTESGSTTEMIVSKVRIVFQEAEDEELATSKTKTAIIKKQVNFKISEVEVEVVEVIEAIEETEDEGDPIKTTMSVEITTISNKKTLSGINRLTTLADRRIRTSLQKIHQQSVNLMLFLSTTT